ncbi:PREDICTED: universal stress protein PHOS32 [Ipomoea nil]|uniref:universal stress protein PHOS32 n=1 Tax=Ipomoea nil TaxID=35883 RepID=UPI000900EB8E|nr:PREDICTED: universal stress protein PHOS32 [Ipomoea nil]
MGRIGATIAIPSFCLNRIRPHVQIRFSPIKNHAKHHGTTKNEDDDEEERRVVKGWGGGGVDEEEEEKKKNSGDATVKFPGRKIMILVDSSLEAKNALQWALTHTVQSQDVVVLLYVTKRSKPSSKQGQEHSNEISPRISEFLSSMKNTCKLKRPEVEVEVAIAEGKEKGPAIVEEARRQGVALLVLGQKKRSTTWRLVMMWAGNRVAAGVGGGGVVEYCIQNATCMAIAVRRKSKKLGGYLITTKRQKDFWLLA